MTETGNVHLNDFCKRFQVLNETLRCPEVQEAKLDNGVNIDEQYKMLNRPFTKNEICCQILKLKYKKSPGFYQIIN